MDADRRLLVSCLDLTALGDGETEGSIAALCERAAQPSAEDDQLTVAAVCIWPRFLPLARDRLRGSPVGIACATGGFPVPGEPLEQRVDQIREAIDAGATEVDVPLNRFLLDEPDALRGELTATRGAAGDATWKAILETGALAPEEILTAGRAAIDAGADFLKTSTGKGPPGVTAEAARLVAEVIAEAGRPVGLKLSGGIRGAGRAADYLELVRATLGHDWPSPATFRIGASALLDALVA
ncbi:MAG: deoxyribose-phosphate aldolase [Actinomycetota bacterium]|nr:deoxyribose-phosphate aldolase [Actinomycetota bacterium]